MSKISNAVGVATELLMERRFAEIFKRTVGLIREQKLTLGLRRDLRMSIVPPKAKIPISVRAIQDSDVAALFPEQMHLLNRKEKIELSGRRVFYDAGVPQCYVAVDERSNEPCYFQWLIGHEHNDFIQSYFPKNWFPVLAKNEVLLENAYTPVAYRGNRIMSEAMAMIAERALESDAQYAVTFVAAENVASLRGCNNAGFSPYLLRREKQMLFNSFRSRQFEPLPPQYR